MNTQINRMSAVWQTLTRDTKLSSYVCEADRIYFDERVKAEGLSFLTVTLPALGKSMYAAFESGVLSPVQGMKRVKDSPYPYFLKSAWETLFSKEGNLRWYDHNPEGVHNPLDRAVFADLGDMYSSAAACIAQLTLMFYKLEMPYSEQQVRDVTTSFIANETIMHNFSLEKVMSEDPVLTGVLNQARKFVRRLLAGSDPLDIVPAHGSGASACNTKPWNRYGKPRYVPKLDAVYDYGTWFYSGGCSLVDNLDELQSLDVHQELCASVCFVPKDSRGPRLISKEPREYMYPQQGLMAKIYGEVEKYPMVRSMVSMIDQSRNRRLAEYASLTGSHGTIDLKDASDLVSLELVRYLFPENWVRCFEACRSTQTKLPDGTIVLLKKFAPMGSACCFPVEALVFWAISLAQVVTTNKIEVIKFTNRLFDRHRQGWDCQIPTSVFGDDIIVPTNCVNDVITTLEKVALKVNRSKCFTRGPFRESCGGDYFLGRNIAAVKWNHIPLDSGSRNAMNYAQFRTVDSMNNLINRYGAWELSQPFAALFAEWYKPIPQLCFNTLLAEDNINPLQSRLMGKSNPKGLALIGWDNIIPDLYNRAGRLMKNKRIHPSFQTYQVLLDCEVAVDIEIDNSDWCHVLRSLLNKGGLKGTSVVSLAKRNKYRQQWVTV